MKKTVKRRMAAVALSVGLLAIPLTEVQFQAYAAEESNDIITNDENGIPDKALYDYVLKKGYTNKDCFLTVEEAEKIQEVDIYSSKITDITGIQYLKNLKKLSIYKSKICDIRSLNGMSNLEKLNLSYNKKKYKWDKNFLYYCSHFFSFRQLI